MKRVLKAVIYAYEVVQKFIQLNRPLIGYLKPFFLCLILVYFLVTSR